MSNATLSYPAIGVAVAAIAALWALNSGFPGNGIVVELLGKPVDVTDSKSPSNLQPSIEFTPQDIASASQSNTVDERPAENGTTTPDPVDDIPVWGTIQTESGGVTNRVRVIFYSRSLNKNYITVSNANGYFYIDAMTPANDYSMWVNPAGMFRSVSRRNVEISPTKSELSIVLEALALGSLSGKLLNSEGIAIPDRGIKIRSREKDLWEASVITDRFGGFQVDQVPIGELEISSTFGPALRITGLEFTGDQQPQIILVVDQGPYSLSGSVFDQYNRPVAGANVVLDWVSSNGGIRSVVNRHRITSSSGQFLVQDIGSGAHELTISASGGSTYRQTIEVNHSNVELTILLSPAGLKN